MVISGSGGTWMSRLDRVIHMATAERGLQWEPYLVGRRGSLKRNAIMLDAADTAVVFWDDQSRGMSFFIDLAIGKGKLALLVTPESIDVAGEHLVTSDVLLAGLAGALAELVGDPLPAGR